MASPFRSKCPRVGEKVLARLQRDVAVPGTWPRRYLKESTNVLTNVVAVDDVGGTVTVRDSFGSQNPHVIACAKVLTKKPAGRGKYAPELTGAKRRKAKKRKSR